MSLGTKLRSFGNSKFGNIKGLAEALEMEPSNLQPYLNDKRKPGSDILKKLLELGCDINWLLTEEDNKIKQYIENKVEQEAKVITIDYEEDDPIRLEIKRLKIEVNMLKEINDVLMKENDALKGKMKYLQHN